MKTKIDLVTLCVIFAVVVVLIIPNTSAPVLMKAEGTTCNWDFVANVRQGPSAGTNVAGTLTIQVGQGGDLSGTLTTQDNKSIPMVGQLNGRAINVAFELQKADPSSADTAAGQYIFGSGTLWSAVSADHACDDNNMGGVFAGPQEGDLGDWRVCTNTNIKPNPCLSQQKSK